jgi:excisionase family DNA binding protein
VSAKRDAEGRFELDLSALALTPAEVAVVIRCGINEVYRLIGTGTLPAIRWGEKNLIVPRRALDDFLNEEAVRQQRARQEEQLPTLPVRRAVASVPSTRRRRTANVDH